MTANNNSSSRPESESPHPWRRTAIQGGASLFALLLIATLHHLLLIDETTPIIMASFGASAILLYGAPHSDMAQPWNIFVGGILSGCIGVAVGELGLPLWFMEALAVALAIIVMGATNSMHPPAGAIAFLGASGDFSSLGFGFVLCPVITGLSIMF
ncbi:MAG: HPP family protein, partial [Mariprofundales bacterium]|nr:HPP family protein [Mariprofundales bacterium]